jgi:hypothetical protein
MPYIRECPLRAEGSIEVYDWVFAVASKCLSRRRGRGNVVIPKGFQRVWEGWQAGFKAFHIVVCVETRSKARHYTADGR